MSKELWAGIGCLILGAGALITWWFEMFSDSWFGELGRAITDEFNLGRNTTAIVEPSVGGFMIFGGGALLVDNSNSLMWIFGPGSLVCLAAAAMGLVPFRLPQFMYRRGRWRNGDGVRRSSVSSGRRRLSGLQMPLKMSERA